MDHSRFAWHRWVAALACSAVSACGGGGGGGSGSPGAATFPGSGAYSWILKASGATNALQFALSVVHPSKPDTEYIVEFGSSVVTDAHLVASGSVDTAARRAAGLQPSFLAYIVGGDVRSLPLQADGTAPANRVQRARSTTACRFVISAIDYAQPTRSRFIVSTAGADGQCGTSDDGRAEVAFDATMAVSFTPITGEAPLDVVRDPQTLAPRGWIYSREVALWGSTPPVTFATRAAAAPAVTSVVSSTYDAALVDDGTQLALQALPGGTTVNETLLDAGITGGGGWSVIGYDADAFYVYRNGGTTFSSTWTVLRVARGAPAATLLATGTGLVSFASMGTTVLYLTVFTANDNRLVHVDKSAGIVGQDVSSTTTLVSMQTSAAGVHQAWTVTGVGSPSPSYRVDMVDETGQVLYTAPEGFPLNVVDAATVGFDQSESRTAFLFASGYNARAFGDATLVTYDAAAKTAYVAGMLPGAATFGNDFVYSNAMGGPTTFGLAYVARSTSGIVQTAGSQVLTFRTDAANTLQPTTAVQ